MNGRDRTGFWLQRIRASGLDVVVLSAAATLFFLQVFRIFVPYLVFEIDQSDRERLASIGGGVFALAFLGALLYRLVGGRMALWLALALLTGARLGIQFTGDPGLRWKLGAAALIGWCWIAIVLLPVSGARLGIGIGFAFALDLIIHGLRGTLDLPWMPTATEHLVTIAIAATLLLSAFAATSPDLQDGSESAFVPSLRYAGIGSGVALWLVAAGNLGFAQMRADLELPATFALLALGALAALASQTELAMSWIVRLDARAVTLVAGLLGAAAVVGWNSDVSRWLDLLLVPVFAFAVTLLTMRAASAAPAAQISGRWRSGATLTLGLLLQTVFVFLYFARSGPMLLMLVPVAVLAAAPLAGQRLALTLPFGQTLLRGVVIATLVSVATLGWLFVDEPEFGSSTPGSANLTVMTFNIQEGFSNENVWSLETTAQTIEAHDPDIVFLQEITRGWLVMSSVDEVRWLADRLDMHYAYSGNSHDGLWGNAILSRLPIVSERSIIYSTTDNLRRGAVAVEVETEAGNLLAIDTHLDNLRKGTPVRLDQIQELVAFSGGTTPAIIAGDFNSDPGSPEWQAMIDAGFVDTAGDDAGTTSEDDRRIDYVWVTPDLQIESYTVPDVWASDHRPVVVDLSLAP